MHARKSIAIKAKLDQVAEFLVTCKSASSNAAGLYLESVSSFMSLLGFLSLYGMPVLSYTCFVKIT